MGKGGRHYTGRENYRTGSHLKQSTLPLPLVFRTLHEVFQGRKLFFFSPKGKSGLKGKVCHIGLPPHLEHAEEVELEMRRGGRGQAE